MGNNRYRAACTNISTHHLYLSVFITINISIYQNIATVIISSFAVGYLPLLPVEMCNLSLFVQSVNPVISNR